MTDRLERPVPLPDDRREAVRRAFISRRKLLGAGMAAAPLLLTLRAVSARAALNRGAVSDEILSEEPGKGKKRRRRKGLTNWEGTDDQSHEPRNQPGTNPPVLKTDLDTESKTDF
ncbi:MAG: hypothetical protein ACOY71_09390 [Gemmatimonadota bacterium]